MVMLAIACLFYLLADGMRTEIGVLVTIVLMLFLIAAGFIIASQTIVLS